MKVGYTSPWSEAYDESHNMHRQWMSSTTEDWWLPVIGPSAFVLGRRCSSMLGQGVEEIDPFDLATLIGLGGQGMAPFPARLTTVIVRLTRFDLATWSPSLETLRLTPVLPLISRRHVLRLAPLLRDLWIVENRAQADVWGLELSNVHQPKARTK